MNGQLSPKDLAPLTGGGHLAKDAARAYNAFDRWLRATGKGHLANAGEGGTYRPLGHQGDYKRGGPFTQWFAWERYQAGGNLAAAVGTSNHGLGHAVDFTPDAIPLVARYGEQFGWAKHGDAMTENWHYTYAPGNYPMVNKWSAVQKGETINPGDCGPGVVEMKKCLAKWGVWPKLWRINDQYAGRTGLAVKKFQQAHRLIADGVVGPTTWKALESNPVVKVKRPIVKTPAVPTPSPNAKYFADIYSGDKYESVAYKNARYSRIVLKATEGHDFVDPEFVNRWNISAGQIRWAYHFARPSANTPQAEAGNFAAELRKVKFTSNDRLVLDWEDPKFDGKDGTAWVQGFVDAMLKYGYEIRVIYSGGYYLAGTVHKWPASKSGPLRYWHAAYIAKPESSVPAIAQKHLYAVQYTDGQAGNNPHTAYGIGSCDMSYVK
jgi:GH25 family lysozyme M1 (1,4-beta-N-acetylmuramidase)